MSHKHLQLSQVIMIIKINESLCGRYAVRPVPTGRPEGRLGQTLSDRTGGTYHVIVEHLGDVAAELRVRSKRLLVHVVRFFVGAVNKQSGE